MKALAVLTTILIIALAGCAGTPEPTATPTPDPFLCTDETFIAIYKVNRDTILNKMESYGGGKREARSLDRSLAVHVSNLEKMPSYGENCDELKDTLRLAARQTQLIFEAMSRDEWALAEERSVRAGETWEALAAIEPIILP